MTMPAVRFLPEAVEDLLETQRWYGRREPALAGVYRSAPLMPYSSNSASAMT